MCRECWWETPKERDHLEDIGVEKRIIVTWVLRQTVGTERSGLIWLWRWKGGRLLRMR